jgi:CBS domain-containing protein
MNIGALCNRDLVSIAASTPLYEVARLMCEHHVGAVVVTRSPMDQPVPVGMITDAQMKRWKKDLDACVREVFGARGERFRSRSRR